MLDKPTTRQLGLDESSLTTFNCRLNKQLPMPIWSKLEKFLSERSLRRQVFCPKISTF